MNNTESDLIAPTLKTIITQDALESLKLKLSTLNTSTGRQNDDSSMYEKFLEFIIDISQCPNPSTYFSEFSIDSLFEEFQEPNNPHNGDLESIKTILVCVLQENILDSEDLECLWRVMRKNTDTYSTVIEILSQSSNNNIKEIFVQNIISHLQNTPVNQMKTSDYKMMSCIFEIYKESDQLFLKQLDSFWQALSSVPESDLVFDAFSKRVNSLIKERRLTSDKKKYLLETCVENVGKERLTLISIRLIRTLIESYPQTTNDKDSFSQESLVRFVCKEKDLLNKVIRELECFITKESDLKGQKSSQAIEMTQFLTFFISSIPGCSNIIAFDVIVSLWKIGLMAGDCKDLQGQLFLLIQKIIEPKIYNNLDIEEFIKFFKEKILLSKDWNSSKFTKEGFDCFKIIFITVNQHVRNISDVRLLATHERDFPSRFELLTIRKNDGCLEEDGDFLFQVDVVPHKLEGYTTLWELACRAEDQSVASKATNLLVYLQTSLNIGLHSQVKDIREEFLNLCFRHLRETPLYGEIFEYQALRCLEILHSFIDQTSKDHPKHPKLHSQLGKGELLTINLKYREAYYHTSERVIRVTSNTLVSDLICKSKKEFEIKSPSIYLEESDSNLVISDHQNTRTLGDLGLTNNATLFVKPCALPQACLILSDKTLNPQAKRIFTQWFENFSDNQKMSPEQCADFVHSCTNDNCRSNDRRVVEVFAKHDDDKDSYLTLDNFLDFYHDACIKRSWVVWNNLLAHKEATDLKPPKKKQEKVEFSEDLNVGSLIGSNKEYIQVLFSLLESKDEIAVKALQLLNRLPTDPQTFADIVTLKGIRDIWDSDSIQPDWSYILDINNIYKIFYCLNIVEYLMDSKRLDENGDEDVKRLWHQDARLVEYKKSWFSDFVACGGSEHLNDIVDKISLFKTIPNIESYLTRIKYLIEAIDKVHIFNMITTLIE